MVRRTYSSYYYNEAQNYAFIIEIKMYIIVRMLRKYIACVRMYKLHHSVQIVERSI
jgi:hypothetical protein